MKDKFTPNYIEFLEDNEVFVFGSNLDGYHLGGAARIAKICNAFWTHSQTATNKRCWKFKTDRNAHIGYGSYFLNLQSLVIVAMPSIMASVGMMKRKHISIIRY